MKKLEFRFCVGLALSCRANQVNSRFAKSGVWLIVWQLTSHQSLQKVVGTGSHGKVRVRASLSFKFSVS